MNARLLAIMTILLLTMMWASACENDAGTVLKGGYCVPNCDLVKADLTEAWLPRADLRGANLQNANLQNTDLTNTKYDRDTKWPQNFDPETAGSILITMSK